MRSEQLGRGKVLATAVGLALLVARTAAASQWATIDFQDPLPFSAVSSQGSTDLAELGNAGPCAPGVFWNRERVAPGAGSGGWNDRGYARYTWCDWDVSRAGDNAELAGWTESGYRFEPGGSRTRGQNNWPAETFFGRFRIYVEQPISPHDSGDRQRQLKFFMWHSGMYDGDQRVIAFLESGANCGGSDTTQICFTLQRNIFHSTDSTTAAIPVGRWIHLQFAWRHGPRGTSFLKIWRNNNAGSPTAEDLNLTTIASQPGGTSTWVMNHAGYDGQFYIGNGANTGTRFDRDFVFRLMDFVLDGRFDPVWAPERLVRQ